MDCNNEDITDIVESDQIQDVLRVEQDIVTDMAKDNSTVTCYSEIFSDLDLSCISAYKSESCPCFSALPGSKAGAYPIAVIAGIQRGAFTAVGEEILREFFDWLRDDSPYSDVVLGYGLNLETKSGYFTVRCDADARLVVAALIAARAAHEYTGIITEWKNLVDIGFLNTPAFLFAHMFNTDIKGKIKLYPKGGAHVALYPTDMTTPGVINYLQHRWGEKLINQYWMRPSSYRGVHNLWGKTDHGLGLGLKVRGLITKLNVGKASTPGMFYTGGDTPITPLDLCAAIDVDRTHLLREDYEGELTPLPVVKRKQKESVTPRTKRERAYKEYINALKEQEDMCFCTVCMDALRAEWLENNPLVNFEHEERAVNSAIYYHPALL